MADVEVLVVRVAAQVGAVGQHGIKVPVALVVGEEGDPSVNPHRVGQVAVQLGGEAFELAVSVAVDPELAGGAAPVALPPGGLAGEHAGQDNGPFVADDGSERDGFHRAQRQLGGPAAREGQAVGVGEAAVGLAEGARDQDVAVGGEALDLGGGVAEVAQLAVAAAVDVRGDNLRCRALNHRPHQLFAVRGEAGVAGGQLQRGHAPGAAPAEGRDPDVVLGHESDQIAVQMRETEVTRRGHRTIIVKTGPPAREVSRPCRAW